MSTNFYVAPPNGAIESIDLETVLTNGNKNGNIPIQADTGSASLDLNPMNTILLAPNGVSSIEMENDEVRIISSQDIIFQKSAGGNINMGTNLPSQTNELWVTISGTGNLGTQSQYTNTAVSLTDGMGNFVDTDTFTVGRLSTVRINPWSVSFLGPVAGYQVGGLPIVPPAKLEFATNIQVAGVDTHAIIEFHTDSSIIFRRQDGTQLNGTIGNVVYQSFTFALI